ncbi:hypothetical protein E1956_05725 [Paraburkholderia pallida]|uniref:Uncharacterized protein n=1 Tax=Paraburkholderia pallida TaxID=2547399 RepID=A0A4P7CLU8_9BURK|nr:hypothetical protein E1956_05725 [Paraburkholderia pallida]
MATNSPNGIQPGSAPGNWSVVNRPALYKPHPENILFDIPCPPRRSCRARKSLISLQVLAAARNAQTGGFDSGANPRRVLRSHGAAIVPHQFVHVRGRQAGSVEVFLGSGAAAGVMAHDVARAFAASARSQTRRGACRARRMRLCGDRVCAGAAECALREAVDASAAMPMSAG